MQEYLLLAAQRLEQFLTTSTLNASNSNLRGKLISFKLPELDIELSDKLNSLILHYQKVFFLENIEQNFLILGIGKALDISENGLGRFASLNKRISEVQNNFISNYNTTELEIPLFCGGMKFNTQHSNDEWMDINDSDWFIPEFTFLNLSGSKHFIYNFIYQNSSIALITEKFSKRLKELLTFEPEDENKAVKVISSTGLLPKDKKKWKIIVQNVVDKLKEQNILKVVISRRIELTLSNTPNWNLIRKYFIENYSSSFIYFFHKNNSTFFGASPERLIKFHKRKIVVDIIAGSTVRGENSSEEKRLEEQMNLNKKLIAEHDFVLHQVKKSLSRYVSKIYSDKMPIKKLKEIQHLHTLLKTEMLSDVKMFDIIEAIFPTAAVCGEPKDKAMTLIKKFEDYDRGLYSGFIGWFNLNDEGEFIVGIRSALLNNKKLFAYAGAGILEESDPNLEFEETELKLKTILNFFNAKGQ